MKRVHFPLEVTFRVFVGIAFAGTISFHLLGLGIHTYIGREKSQLVSQIESIAEVRSGVSGLESSLTVLRERSGRILSRSFEHSQRVVKSPDIRAMLPQFHMMFLLLKNFERSDPDPSVQLLKNRWSLVFQSMEKCQREESGSSYSCLEVVQSRLSDFIVQMDVLRVDVSGKLLHVEHRQGELEHWDTMLYWLTTVLGLLFMAVSWRNVLLQVGNPIQELTDYLESYQEKSPSVKPKIPGLFSIRELRILKQSMTNVHNDYLTGLLARHAIMGVLEREIAFATRYGTSLTVAIFDVDFFKKVNDQYGHLSGDQALKHIADKIQSSCRLSDWIGRWGGEEFLLICPGLTREDAQGRLDEFRENVQDPLEISSSVSLTLSVSVGAAFFPPQTSPEDLIGMADCALYRAKEMGRNRVVLS